MNMHQAIAESVNSGCPVGIDEWDSIEQILSCIPEQYELDYFDVSNEYELEVGWSATCVEGWDDNVTWQIVAFVPA